MRIALVSPGDDGKSCGPCLVCGRPAVAGIYAGAERGSACRLHIAEVDAATLAKALGHPSSGATTPVRRAGD